MAFQPALIVVDFQEDFCPPHGTLAVPDARAIAPTINALLALPFTVKLATRDWHPPTHVSFAANHPGTEPYTSTTTISHATKPSYQTTLWPVHCVQNTPGAELVAELQVAHLHGIVDKGMVADREMYSAFYDPFGESGSGLVEMLRDSGVTHAYVVGLASDYCVKATALHARDEGLVTYIVEDATRPVFPEAWPAERERLVAEGIVMIDSVGDEVERVRQL